MTATPYVLRGATLALSWLVVVNLIATTAVVTATRRRAVGSRPRSARFWLAMRLCPAATSMAFVLFLFVPSYWRYEPRNLGEPLDFTLLMSAAGGSVLIALGAARALGAWCAAVRRTREWGRMSRPLAVDAAGVPVFAIEVSTPMMALVGVWRPRLLVTRGVLEALTAEELRAGVAHEVGHWRARDNLKRLAMRAAPDLLFLTSAAPVLESRWASAAEHAADRGACDDAHARCALASALVKIARLTPARSPLAEPISTLVDGGEIASRVECLLSEPDPVHSPTPWPALAAGAVFAAATYGPILHLVHEATEFLVRGLP